MEHLEGQLPANGCLDCLDAKHMPSKIVASQAKEAQARHARKARQLYLRALKPDERAADWHFALREARRYIADALKASVYLHDLEKALESEGRHMLVFRHLCAPPLSQDQFKLRCASWKKTSEKGGSRLSADEALKVANAFADWRDRHLTRWLDKGRPPRRSELRKILISVSSLIAGQRIATARRNRIAAQQEKEVIDLLLKKRWKKLPSRDIDTRAAVPTKHFMYKTKFATASKNAQEVDIACGLKGTVVLAMECKVTNDETNSVKRVNDVIKKATAWKEHYGSFLVTAALLQGVIAAKDIYRLIDSGVLVFWSHRLGEFGAWLDEEM